MRTTVLTVIGATLIALSTIDMAAAADHHARRNHAQVVEQFRNSNAYYAAPDNFGVRSPTLSEQVEGAMTSGIAGR